MSTRIQEKKERAKYEKESLDEKIRLRAIGQDMKDTGFGIRGKKTKRSPSRREKKKYKKLETVLGHLHPFYIGSELACKICNPYCYDNHQMGNIRRLRKCGHRKCPLNKVTL